MSAHGLHREDDEADRAEVVWNPPPLKIKQPHIESEVTGKDGDEKDLGPMPGLQLQGSKEGQNHWHRTALIATSEPAAGPSPCSILSYITKG